MSTPAPDDTCTFTPLGFLLSSRGIGIGWLSCVGVHPDFRRSCRARLQAGTVNSSTCLPKGERYRTWPQVPPQTLIWRASSRTRTRSYRNTDSRKTPMFEFNAPVREISDGLRVRNNENRVPCGV